MIRVNRGRDQRPVDQFPGQPRRQRRSRQHGDTDAGLDKVEVGGRSADFIGPVNAPPGSRQGIVDQHPVAGSLPGNDQPRRIDICPADGARPERRVVPAHDENEPIAGELAKPEPGLGGRDKTDAEIGIALGDRVGDIVGVVVEGF